MAVLPRPVDVRAFSSNSRSHRRGRSRAGEPVTAASPSSRCVTSSIRNEGRRGRVLAGDVQRRCDLYWSTVDIRAFLQQQPRRVDVACRGRRAIAASRRPRSLRPRAPLSSNRPHRATWPLAGERATASRRLRVRLSRRRSRGPRFGHGHVSAVVVASDLSTSAILQRPRWPTTERRLCVQRRMAVQQHRVDVAGPCAA